MRGQISPREKTQKNCKRPTKACETNWHWQVITEMAGASEIILIHPGQGAAGVDKNGFKLPLAQETRTEVFAAKMSVGCKEFYQAQQAGREALMKFRVHAAEYEGQLFAEYEGKRYKILRTYTPEDSEETELTLSDLSERSENGG